jgi:phosphatidate cytidylyltransferase
LGAIAGMWVVYTLGEKELIDFPSWPLGRYLLTGAALSVVAQLGDFVESMLKRAAGVKDAGAILPGHGGVLDRCDGFLLASPVLYYIAYF